MWLWCCIGERVYCIWEQFVYMGRTFLCGSVNKKNVLMICLLMMREKMLCVKKWWRVQFVRALTHKMRHIGIKVMISDDHKSTSELSDDIPFGKHVNDHEFAASYLLIKLTCVHFSDRHDCCCISCFIVVGCFDACFFVVLLFVSASRENVVLLRCCRCAESE